MNKVIVIGKVQEMKKWEEGFRTRADLFRSQTIVSPVHFAAPEAGDQIAVLFEVRDVDTFLRIFESPAVAEAMAQDGIDKGTTQVFVLEKEYGF